MIDLSVRQLVFDIYFFVSVAPALCWLCSYYDCVFRNTKNHEAHNDAAPRALVSITNSPASGLHYFFAKT